MKRREFIAGIGAAAAWPGAVRAEQSSRVYRIAVLSVAAPISEMTESGSYPSFVPFFKELRRLGYIEGKNLVVLRFSAGGDSALHASIVSDSVRAAPDLIIAVGSGLALAVKTATTTIPILGAMGDPVANGIVASLAHPGANISGISSDAGVEIWGKRLAILREAIPSATRFGVLASEIEWDGPFGVAIREVARQASVSVVGSPLHGAMQEPEYRRVFETMEQEKAQVLSVSESAYHYAQRRLIVELAESSRLPAIYSYREFVELGGLMGYVYNIGELWRQLANYTDQVLKGTKPGELPIYQPTKYNFIINLKTAKSLGLEIPPTLLARADEVIE
jgi:putative tryptophan/tyrosine transport system substrate-binding protein